MRSFRLLATIFVILLCWGVEYGFARERIVVVTQELNPVGFWNVVKNGVDTAAKDMNVDVEYHTSGDWTEMASIIDAAVVSKPDGLIVSSPISNMLDNTIKSAVKEGIPVVSINSDSDVQKSKGCLFYMGQPEYEAGLAGGKRAKKAGVKKGLCVNHEIYNAALEQRCKGYCEGLGIPSNMLDIGNDPMEIQNRVAAYLSTHPEVDGIITLGPQSVVPTMNALTEMGKLGKIHLSAFDLSPEIIKGIKSGVIAFAIDRQQYLQGYLPVVALALNIRYGQRPKGDILTGPEFIYKGNIEKVERLTDRIQ